MLLGLLPHHMELATCVWVLKEHPVWGYKPLPTMRDTHNSTTQPLHGFHAMAAWKTSDHVTNITQDAMKKREDFLTMAQAHWVSIGTEVEVYQILLQVH